MPAPTKAELQLELTRLRRRLAALERRAERAESALRAGEAREGALARQVQESLEQQTATAEVLKVISRSTFDLQPVLDTLIENATRLCGARRGAILRREGDAYHGVAFYNVSPDLIEFIRRHPITPGRHSVTARVALERRTIHIADLQADPEYRYALRDIDPIRTELGVPMFRGDEILGVIILYQLEVQPFTDKQIELVVTFADQAVIAIENVRLFNELQARNRDLTEALEQQTATSDILRVISSYPTDLQPVLDTIAESAARVCGAHDATVCSWTGTASVGLRTTGPFRMSSGGLDMPLSRGRSGGAPSSIAGRPGPRPPQDEDFPEGRELARQIGYQTHSRCRSARGRRDRRRARSGGSRSIRSATSRSRCSRRSPTRR